MEPTIVVPTRDSRPTKRKRRQRPLKLSQVAAIGFKKQRPPNHRAAYEARTIARERLLQVRESLARLREAAAAAGNEETVVGTIKHPEQVARDFERTPNLFLEGELLLPPWGIQWALERRLAEMEAHVRHGSRGVILQAELGIGKTLIVLLRVWRDALARVCRCFPFTMGGVCVAAPIHTPW